MDESNQDSLDYSITTSVRYDPMLLKCAVNNAFSPNAKRGTPFYMLSHHRDRMLNAVEHFNWGEKSKSKLSSLWALETFLLEQVAAYAAENSPEKPLKLRIVLTYPTILKVAFDPVPETDPRTLFPASLLLSTQSSLSTPVWSLYLDSEPTPKTSYTRHKTTSRDPYAAALVRLGITSPFANPAAPVDALLFTRSSVSVQTETRGGEVSETSSSSIYFLRPIVNPQGQGLEGEQYKWVTPSLSSGCHESTTRRWALEQGFCVEEAVHVASLVDGEWCCISNGVRGFRPARVVLTTRK